MNFSKITSFVLFLFFLGFSAHAKTEIRTPGNFNAIESGGSGNANISIKF